MGGRGAGYDAPNGNKKDNFSPFSLGTKVADTLKEALGKKSKSINMEKAYKDANPNYDPRGTYDEYRANCQRCVVAYEMRRRGYDVTAQPTYANDTLGRVVRQDKSGAEWSRWQGAFRNARPISVKAKTPEGVVKNIRDKMKSFGEGSRGVVSITYVDKRGRTTNTGHVFNVEQRKNTTYFVDAQTGNKIRAKEFFKITDLKTVTLTRTDNLRISDRTRNFVTSDSAYKRRKK